MYSFLISDLVLLVLSQGSESIKIVKFQCYDRFLFPNYFIFSLILQKEIFTYLNLS